MKRNHENTLKLKKLLTQILLKNTIEFNGTISDLKEKILFKNLKTTSIE